MSYQKICSTPFHLFVRFKAFLFILQWICSSEKCHKSKKWKNNGIINTKARVAIFLFLGIEYGICNDCWISYALTYLHFGIHHPCVQLIIFPAPSPKLVWQSIHLVQTKKQWCTFTQADWYNNIRGKVSSKINLVQYNRKQYYCVPWSALEWEFDHEKIHAYSYHLVN